MPLTDPGPATRPGRLGVLWPVFVAALAFLLAATPARNSDLWLHLASGRLLAQGRFPGGTDPFASTTAGAVWINHSWLSDAILYELYAHGGGRALLIAKCVLVAVLAGCFFAFRRRGTRGGIVAGAAIVAVLALGPWLLLQPTLISLLGVVLTLYLLEQAEGARRWLVAPLFALWANLDAWFLLGPVLVGLYALGELLFGKQNESGRARIIRHPSSLILFFVGLAACLLTPYHYRTFAWPTPLGLTHAEQVLMHGDPLGQRLVVSPFTAFPTGPAFASPGGWAYCLLLVAGVVSFGLCGRALHPGRLLAWLALAALSVYQARAIPFFAVAAGPILALNVQEWARRKETPGNTEVRRWRILPLLLPVGLLVLAWPGWLQPAPYQPRAWAVEPDASMVRLARRLAVRVADPALGAGLLTPPRVPLTFSPEAAHYLAWFCPAEKGFFDSRWSLFGRVAEDYVRLRRGLLAAEESGPDPALARLLDEYQIDRVVLYDPDWGRTARVYRRLLLDEPGWDLLALEGSAALFGRRAGASPASAFDPRQAAYHPAADRRAPLAGPRAPRPSALLDAFSRARDDRSADRGEAALHLLTFDLRAERRRADLERQWLLGLATGLAGSGPGSETAGTASALAVRLYLTPLSAGPSVAQQFAAGFLALHDHGPIESLLLAVRAARRALAANPDDAGAFFLLGEAYLRLARQTREPGWLAVLPELATLRRTQALTALEQAVLLRPDLDEAHAALAQFYSEAGQLDRTLDHLRAQLRIAARAAAAERQAALRADVEALEELVRHAEDIYQANTQGRTDPAAALDQARLAARHGLARKALELLLESHPAIFGQAGTLLELDLMLRAGRAFEVRAWLEPEHEAVLGFTPYHSLKAWSAAACGDYAAADVELDQLAEPLRRIQIAPGRLAPVRAALALRVGGAVLARPVLGGGAAALAGLAFRQFDELAPLGSPADLLRQDAGLRVLRGLLALECGDVDSARAHVRAALDVWGGTDRADTGAGLDFPARPIAEQVMRLLEGTGPSR